MIPNQAYYDDPRRYDLEYAPFGVDRDWYSKTALRYGSPVLELGCGTGRILIPMATLGLVVDGLDNAMPMLDRAREKLLLLPTEITSRINFFHAHLANFNLGRQYNTILAPLNCLMHLLHDHDFHSCLVCVKKHLTPTGRFVFDLTLPKQELIEETSHSKGLALRLITIDGVTYLQYERHQYDETSRISTMRHLYEPQSKAGTSFATELSLRMYPPQEVNRLLQQAGFQIECYYGNFDEESPNPDQDVMQLIVARYAE